jgi:hypothetical protein
MRVFHHEILTPGPRNPDSRISGGKKCRVKLKIGVKPGPPKNPTRVPALEGDFRLPGLIQYRRVGTTKSRLVGQKGSRGKKR